MPSVFGSDTRSALKRTAILLCLVWLAGGSTLLHARQGQMIHLVTFEEPPFSYLKDDAITGLVVKSATELVKRAGYRHSLRMVPAKRALILASVQENTCVFPIERSQEREVQYKWVSPILISRYGLYGLPDREFDIFVLNDAKDYKIGSSLGSSIGEYLDSLGFVVEFAHNNEANLHKLFLNRIQLWASDTLSAPFLAGRNGFEAPKLSMTFFTRLRAMGCNQSLDDEDIENLNRVLIEMYRDGSFKQFESMP